MKIHGQTGMLQSDCVWNLKQSCKVVNLQAV